MWEMKTINGSESALAGLFDFFAEQLERVFPLQVEADLFLLNVVEAVNNAVEHGHTGNEQQCLNVSYCLKPNQAFVIVKDFGCGFNPQIPGTTEAVGARGRGLGMIKNNSDAILLNRCGNEIAFFKGGFLIDCLIDRDDILTLTNGVMIVTGLRPKSGIHSDRIFHDLFKSLKKMANRNVFLDLKHFRILTSREWGAVLAEARDDEVALMVLFNVGEAIVQTSQQLGIQEYPPFNEKIRIFTGLEPTIHLLENLLRPVEKTENVE